MTAPCERTAEWGYDPWLNDATRPEGGAAIPEVVTASHPFTGADTIGADIPLLPNGLNMYASYVDNYGGYPELVNRFGDHFHGLLLSISVNPPGHPARCGDFEPGGLRNTDLPDWYDHRALKDGGQLPWCYTNAGNMDALIREAGGRPFHRWSAHWGFGPHVCGPHTCGYPQSDWTQWAPSGPQGENYDRSIGLWLPSATPPKPGSGNWHAAVTFDGNDGRWVVHGMPGHVVPDTKDEWDSAELQVNRKREQWRIHPMPANSPPLRGNVPHASESGDPGNPPLED